MPKNKLLVQIASKSRSRHRFTSLRLAACAVLGLLAPWERAAAVTETFDSYANGTVLTTIGGSGVWTIGANTVIDAGGVAGSKGLGTSGTIFNWKAQPFVWSTLATGTKLTMSLDFQTDASGKFDDDRVGWTITPDASTSTGSQLALQLDNSQEGGMVLYHNSTRTPVLNALAGLKISTWYRFNVEFTKLTSTSAGVVGTLTELNASGNPTGTPYVGTIADTSTFANPPSTALFTAAGQCPSFKNYNTIAGNADNASFTITLPGPQPPTVSITSPTNNAIVTTNFTITATATDSDGTVTNVYFYDGSTLLGSDPNSPYSYDVSGAAVGSHALKAVAWDNTGLAATSAVVNVTVSTIVNVAPNAPATVAPVNGALGVATNTTLTVAVSDPNGDPMSVVFYGRPVTNAAPGSDFTVVVLPDTQFYSESYPAIFQAQTDWIVNNRVARNIVYVTGEGDVINVPTDAQYQNSTNAWFRLENPATTGLPQGIPYGVPVGNHDSSPYTLFNTYYGTSHWTGRSYYGGSYSTGYQNHYDLFSAGGLDFIMLSLEFNAGANSAIMTWANGILQANANRRAIVVTHSLLQAGYNWPTPAAWSTDGGTAIFPALTNNPNLFLMLCGHNHGQGRRHELVGNRAIDVLLADYQADVNGGDGYLRTLEFSPSNNVIRIKTYSPTTLGSKTDGDNQFTLDYAMVTLPPFTALGTNTAVASGAQTSMAWANRNQGTTYQWYATASDGTGPVSGPTNSFTTATETSTFHFTVTADPRDYHTAFSNILSGIKANVGGPGAFHVCAGDYDNTMEENRQQVDGNFGANFPWYIPVGNHETETEDEMVWVRAEYNTGNSGRPAYKLITNQDGPLGSKETMYSWDYGNAHFVALNEYWDGTTAAGSDRARDGDVVQAERDWLAANLATNRNKAIIVFGHEPAFLPDGWNHKGDCLDLYPANRDAFWSLLETNSVVAYINGHTHSYYKLQPNPGRTWDIDAGNAGNDTSGQGYTFLDITVSATNVQFDVWRDAAKTGAWSKSAESFSMPLLPPPPNQPPAVGITSPTNNAAYASGASIAITANATDDGTVTNVAFYDGSTLLGSDATSPYGYTWNGAAAGAHALKAVAWDNAGLAATSVVVNVTVALANQAPTVAITNLIDNATVGTNFTIAASAADSDGTVTNVSFYADGTLLGNDTTSPYSYIWNGATAGAHALKAVAWDNGGLTITSTVVNVTVALANQAPTVAIASPTNSATVGANFTITATAADSDGSVTNVSFYADNTLLGSDATSPYSYTWTTAALGAHALKAVAWDNSGLAATSAVVNVTVTSGQVQYVIVISVDGLGGTYLNKIFNGTATGGPYAIPNFTRLKNEGASTLAAHCDNDNWETLPNHTSIMTARPQVGAAGHNWTLNSDPAVGQTIHSVKGSYVASGFDVAHDNGLRTGMYANKSKFSLFDTYGSYTGGGSYNATYGALDTTGADNGRDKIDNPYINTTLGGIVVDTFIAQQKTASPNQYAFVHINEPDANGHGSGWGSATWNSSVVTVDGMLGKIFKLIEQDVPAMKGNTAIILTADHGNQDNPPTGADRYSVPFFVWGPGVPAGADLYALNASTRQVASSYPMTTYSGMQPIRNAEASNVALQLLGLGPIPGSTFSYAQDLVLALPTPKPTITLITGPTNGVFSITGSADQSGKVVLWKATSLAAPVWVPIQTNTVSSGVPFSFSVPQGADSKAFFRMMGQ